MPGWVKVGRVDGFRAQRGRAVEIDGRRVAVFRTADGFAAFTDACPHMGASLADGRLVGDVVECVWHHWRYDVRTGRSTEREWACVAIYPVKVERGEVYVLAPEPPTAADPEDDEPEWLRWDVERYFRNKAD